MRLGLYGKLPAKRDFIATGSPREFLAVWEPWLQGSISASRMQLGAGWQETYLRAPIWRFWLGEAVSGATTLGALMPSVDGVGRYFPLTVFARAEPDGPIPPPDIEANEAWLGRAEDLLLSALGEGATLDALTAGLEAIGAPATTAPDAPDGTAIVLPDGSVVSEVGPSGLAATLSVHRTRQGSRADRAGTFWWTIGGEDFPPRAVTSPRMPDPYLFAAMLTGRFEPGPT